MESPQLSEVEVVAEPAASLASVSLQSKKERLACLKALQATKYGPVASKDEPPASVPQLAPLVGYFVPY